MFAKVRVDVCQGYGLMFAKVMVWCLLRLWFDVCQGYGLMFAKVMVWCLLRFWFDVC